MRATGLEKSILLNRFKRKIVCISVEIHKICSVKEYQVFPCRETANISIHVSALSRQLPVAYYNLQISPT